MPPKQRSHGARTPTKAGGGAPGPGGLDRRVLALAAGGLAVVVAIVLAVTLSGGGDDAAAGGSASAARAALEAAGCTLEEVAALKGADHSIADPDLTSPKWNTDPPTSGPHYAETMIYGSYTEPIQQARALHNLEHGAVTIQYGTGVAAETVSALEAFTAENATGTILAPYPKLGEQVKLSAWNADNPADPGVGVQATCTAYDEAAYGAFLSAFQFKGPERFDPSTMLPGSA